MAKTKQQKQIEALQRKRSNFPKNLRDYAYYQYPMEGYHTLARMYGEDYAKKRAEEMKTYFHRYCAEAKLDLHGNFLEVQ